MKIICILLSLTAFGTAELSLNSYLSSKDKERLESVLESGLKKSEKSKDYLSSIHYSTLGLKVLGHTKLFTHELCTLLNSKLESDSIVDIYQAASSLQAASCKPVVPSPKTKEVVVNSMISAMSLVNLYYGASSAEALGIPIDSKAVSSLLKVSLSKDDSLTSYGVAFSLGSLLPPKDSGFLYDKIPVVFKQADEVDQKMLQFEGGLTSTQAILTGSIKLGIKLGKPLALSPEQILKFSNYFLSRKSVTGIKGASCLLQALESLTTDVVPVVLSLSSSSMALSSESPVLRLRLSNLLGAPLDDGKLKVTCNSMMNDDGTSLQLINSPIDVTPLTENVSIYEFNVLSSASSSPSYGYYNLLFSVSASKDSRILGVSSALLKIKVVLPSISIHKLTIGSFNEASVSSPSKLHSLTYPKSLSSPLSIDYHHFLRISFSIREKDSEESFAPHQVFLRFFKSRPSQEIIYLVDKTTSSSYKFELDVSSKADDFKRNSGTYTCEVIVGDSFLNNSVIWNVGQITLEFPSDEEETDKKRISKVLPEIRHIFRAQEIRPSSFVSNTFTLLSLSPLALMVFLWKFIGVSVTLSPCSLSALGFHVGLAGIFLLYALFWIQLNMFTTIKLLVVLGVFTFLCGNSMLVKFAEKRKMS